MPSATNVTIANMNYSGIYATIIRGPEVDQNVVQFKGAVDQLAYLSTLTPSRLFCGVSNFWCGGATPDTMGPSSAGNAFEAAREQHSGKRADQQNTDGCIPTI